VVSQSYPLAGTVKVWNVLKNKTITTKMNPSNIPRALRLKYDSLTNRDSPFAFEERLDFVLGPTTFCADFRKTLKKRIKKDQSGIEYLEIGKYKIYFNLDIEPLDYDRFMEGIAMVIGESFIHSEYFGRGIVPKKNDIVFDLGANIGTITLLLSEYVGAAGKVYAFEPVTIRALEKNIEVNDLRNCEAVNCGVSNASGETEIQVSSYCIDSTISKDRLPNYFKLGTKKIRLIALDEFCESKSIDRVDFIKMDIEGAEELAILGATKTIEEHHPVWSIASYHRLGPKHECQHSRLKGLLKEYDYRIMEIPNGHIFAFQQSDFHKTGH
jgi:FkbM family methyltransferase